MIYYLKFLKDFKYAYTLILSYIFSVEYVQAGGKQYSGRKTEFNTLPTFLVETFVMCKYHRVSMKIFALVFFLVLVFDWYNTGCMIMCIFPC